MYNKFAELLKTNGVKTSDVVKATGIAASTMSDWKSGKTIPKLPKLQKIADYFNVPVNYFLDVDTKQLNEMAERASVVLDSPYVQLAKRIEALPADKRKSLEEYLCFLEQK